MAGEAAYRNRLAKKVRERLPGSTVLKNDPRQNQGIPDLTVLYEDRWGMLEVKMAADAPVQPNQPYYVEKFNGDSFAAFIYPENEAEVLDDLQSALSAGRKTRIPKSK